MEMKPLVPAGTSKDTFPPRGAAPDGREKTIPARAFRDLRRRPRDHQTEAIMTTQDRQCPCHSSTPSPSWSTIGAPRPLGAVAELLALAARPEVISFGGGLPSPDGFPYKAIEEACDRVLETASARALQYSGAQGIPELREEIAKFESTRGVETRPEEVLVVSGSQQALDLVCRALVEPGDRILVECPTYLGALDAFRLSHPEIPSLPADEHGLIPEQMGEECRGAKFAYVMPTFQNPTGLTIDEGRREALARKARELDLWLLEDNPYGELFYGEAPAMSMRGYARERTITLGTMSKILAPGLRLGYVLAPEHVIRSLTALKTSMDLHSSTFTQMIVAEVMRSGLLKEHLPFVRNIYKHKAGVMLEALERFMPRHPGVSWTHPTGGMFIWLNLPEGIDAEKLLRRVLASDVPVGFVPGEHFYACEKEKNHARFSFVTVPEERIIRGVESVAKALKAMIDEG